jgi:prolyl 4-hydroxylase
MDRKLIFMGIGVLVLILLAWYFMPPKPSKIKSDNREKLDVNKIPETMTELIDASEYKTPILGAVKNFLSPDECQELINIGKMIIKPSTVGFGDAITKNDKHRISSHSWIKHQTTPATLRLTQYISSILKIPPTHFEPFQIVNYQKGGFYNYHLDSCNPDAEDYKECLKNLAQHGGRKYTVLIYLNDNYEGGETHFKVIDTSIKGNTGDIVFFKNMLKDSQKSDPKSIHSGTPVKSGEKWLLNLWIRDSPYKADYSDSSFPCASMLREIEEKAAKIKELREQELADIQNGTHVPSKQPPVVNKNNHHGDHNADHNGDHNADHNADHNGDHQGDHNGDHQGDHQGDHNADHQGDD